MLAFQSNRNMTGMNAHHRSRVVALLVVALGMGACANDSVSRTDPANDKLTANSVNGEVAYGRYCAGCHETGMMGAPMVGDADEWADRSELWDAVLLDHAITGYLEMPARGGRMDLPDEIVKAAAEFMLETTFPDRLHDCNPPTCGENGTWQ